MLSIEELRKYNSAEHYVITEHARLRLFERGISIDDIQKAIADGEIIHQYEDDRPFPHLTL